MMFRRSVAVGQAITPPSIETVLLGIVRVGGEALEAPRYVQAIGVSFACHRINGIQGDDVINLVLEPSRYEPTQGTRAHANIACTPA